LQLSFIVLALWLARLSNLLAAWYTPDIVI
jgi:hypothetical protein